MNVLVDTSVWSLALRRKKSNLTPEELIIVDALKELIKELRVSIIGPVRQEILSGISSKFQFKKLQNFLLPFKDLVINSEDYERAAEFYNICRKKGIQGSHIDFIICAVSERYELQIFTTDKDFSFYSKHLNILIYNNMII